MNGILSLVSTLVKCQEIKKTYINIWNFNCQQHECRKFMKLAKIIQEGRRTKGVTASEKHVCPNTKFESKTLQS